MHAMSNARHAHLARELIAANGGARKAADHCRVERTRLYEFQDETLGEYMPADVIADLESACGLPVYSRGILEHRPATSDPGTIVDEASALTEVSASLQRVARLAVADKILSRDEQRQLLDILHEIRDQVRLAELAVEHGRI